MDKITWDDSLSVNVNLIDDQHKMLIKRLNDMAEAVDQKRGIEKISKTLNFMIEYTEFHFSTEEKHMTEQDYPGKAEHQKQHGEFVTVLNDLVQDFEEEGATQLLANSIDTFLVNWLVNHIKGTDVQFGKFLNEKGFVSTD
jgi:hemerythrin-like metal-binding protein